MYLKSRKETQGKYKLLNENNDPYLKWKKIWNKKYNFDDNECNNLHIKPFIINKDSTVQWFQTKINHRILGTSTFLCKIKLTYGSMCTFCSIVDETIEHLFWECEYVNKFLKEAITWLSNKTYILLSIKCQSCSGYTKI